jgi:hypothetical protein
MDRSKVVSVEKVVKYHMMCTMDDGTVQEAFSYYPEEVAIKETELIGFTLEECMWLLVTKLINKVKRKEGKINK